MQPSDKIPLDSLVQLRVTNKLEGKNKLSNHI